MQQPARLDPVDYLVIGHIARDLTPSGPRLGGTVAYSGLTARALGLRVGIVTSWDIAKAIACDHVSLEEIMSQNVITTTPDASIEEAAKKMAQHTISALPVVDEEGKVVGMVSSEGLSTLVGRCR